VSETSKIMSPIVGEMFPREYISNWGIYAYWSYTTIRSIYVARAIPKISSSKCEVLGRISMQTIFSSMSWPMCLLPSCPVVVIIWCCVETSATGLGLDQRLSTTLMELGLTQHITQPTRDDRLLHIVASDDAIPVRNVLVSDNHGIPDHTWPVGK